MATLYLSAYPGSCEIYIILYIDISFHAALSKKREGPGSKPDQRYKVNMICMSDKHGVKGFRGMHRFNICLENAIFTADEFY